MHSFRENAILILVASALIGYLLGGIPSGLLVGRARGVDLRTAGSRNIGATNAFRVLGPKWGALVFALDALKGYLATLAPRLIATAPPGSFPPPMVAALTGGLAAILGHVFTPWLRFRGGRGVATSLGVFLGIAPIPTLIAFAIWILLVRISRRVSVGSIIAAAAYPFLVFELAPPATNRGVLTGVAAAVALLVLARHLPNMRRLLNGTEPPIFGAARKEGPP